MELTTWKEKDMQQAFQEREILPHVSAHMIKCVRAAGDYERLKTRQTAALNTEAGEEGFDSDVLSKEALSQCLSPTSLHISLINTHTHSYSAQAQLSLITRGRDISSTSDITSCSSTTQLLPVGPAQDHPSEHSPHYGRTNWGAMLHPARNSPASESGAGASPRAYFAPLLVHRRACVALESYFEVFAQSLQGFTACLFVFCFWGFFFWGGG